MKRRYTRGRQSKRRANRLISMAVLVFMLSGVGSTLLLQEGGNRENEGVTGQAKEWMERAVNRGNGGHKQKQSLDEKLVGLLATTYPLLATAEVPFDRGKSKTSGGEKNEEKSESDVQMETGSGGKENEWLEGKSKPADSDKPSVPVVDTAQSDNPVVLIYHTHATESYQPVTEGNFHSLGEEGTVRQVGNAVEQALQSKGIPVLHDMTIHDSPSYNQSYSRSIETVKNHLAQNPSIQIVIDLHRDAASYAGNKRKTVTIKGETAAAYSLVVGQGNANVKELMAFAGDINATAERLYPGFGGRIIEKDYRFNQYVCNRDLLLEIGNNENTIEQAKVTGKYFADVLEDYLKRHP